MSQANIGQVQMCCRICAANTMHEIRCCCESVTAPVKVTELWQQAPLFVIMRAEILQCQGCATISFRQGWASALDVVPSVWTMYPNPEARKPITAAALLPTNIRRIYTETLQAISARSYLLAAAGMRAMVEAICQMHGCKGQDLQQRISKLKGANGVLSSREASALHTHRTFGNEALHKMRAPSPTETSEALAILEHILKTLYELPYRTENLARMRRDRNLGKDTVDPHVVHAS